MKIKTEEDLKKLFKACMKFWGLERQLRMTQEECAELIVAISHALRRRKGSVEHLIEELADAQLMIDQIIYEIGKHKIDEIRYKKANHIKNKLIEAGCKFDDEE